jgi:uncharacterized delta-60 repeat protein
MTSTQPTIPRSFGLLRRGLFLLILLLCSPAVLHSAPGALDPTFATGSIVNNIVNAVVPAAEGKIYVAGAFTTVRGALRNSIARLNPDGTVDPTFDPGTGANRWVHTVAVQTDGKVLIGGEFTTYNGTARNYIARLNSDGSLDRTFDTGTGLNSSVSTVAVQTDGKVLIGGAFTTYKGTERNYIARLNSDGSLDRTFDTGTGTNATVKSVAVQTDGKVLIGGYFTSYNGTVRNRIARLNSDGSLDTTFNPLGVGHTVFAVAVQTDGKVLLGGSFTICNSIVRNRIARLNSDGSLDTTFNPGMGASDTVFAVAVQADGKVLLGGEFFFYEGILCNHIARLNSDGTLDADFTNTGTDDRVNTVAVQADGKVLIGGYFTSYNGSWCNFLARFNSDRSLDTTFNPSTGTNTSVFAVAVQKDGKVLLVGDFTSYNGMGRKRIVRLNSDGSLDHSFDPGIGASDAVNTVAIQTDGKVLIGGRSDIYNNTIRSRIVRLNTAGSLDATFNPGRINASVSAVAVQADGKVLLGGLFTIIEGGSSFNSITASGRIARLNSDGSGDMSFNPGTGANNWVGSVVVQTDGKVLIGGAFTSYNSTTRNRIARLNSDGSLDTSFNPGTGANDTVSAVAVQTDGKVLIGGAFTSYNSTGRNRIVRLNSDGSLDTSFAIGTGPNAWVNDVAVLKDGKVLTGGAFTSYNGSSAAYLLRVEGNPTITGVTSSTADVAKCIGSSISVQVTFSEAMTVTGTPQLTLETGSTDRVIDYTSGSGSDTLTFNYTVQSADVSADLDYASTNALALNNGTINATTSGTPANLTLPVPGTTGSLGANKALVIEGERPTASIVVADTSLASGETSLVTITFSEAVTGFDNADLSPANGVLTLVGSSDHGITWTATFTPAADITDISNVITLDNTGVMDLVGNSGSGTTTSNPYAIHTSSPEPGTIQSRLSSSLTMNANSGLLEGIVRVTNDSPYTLDGLRLFPVFGTAPHKLWNPTFRGGNFIEVIQTIAPAGTVDIPVKIYSTSRTLASWKAAFRAEAITETSIDPVSVPLVAMTSL